MPSHPIWDQIIDHKGNISTCRGREGHSLGSSTTSSDCNCYKLPYPIAIAIDKPMSFPFLPSFLLRLFRLLYCWKIPKNNLYWNLVKLVCPQISSFQSGHSLASLGGGNRNSAEYIDTGNIPTLNTAASLSPSPFLESTPLSSTGNPRGSGVFSSAQQFLREGSRGESVAGGGDSTPVPSFSETFRSVPRFSRRQPMSVFMPPERAIQLRLSTHFMSFLTACLRYDADERITAGKMLQHPFLQVI